MQNKELSLVTHLNLSKIAGSWYLPGPGISMSLSTGYSLWPKPRVANL